MTPQEQLEFWQRRLEKSETEALIAMNQVEACKKWIELLTHKVSEMESLRQLNTK